MAASVEIKWYEFLSAVHVGVQRFAFGEARSMNHAATERRDWIRRLIDEIVGACGELVWAKWTNQFWDASVNTYHHTPDVNGVEVRATLRDDGSLIIRDNDRPSRWYVLVTGCPPRMIIQGWIKGDDARQPEHLDNPRNLRPAWFVPQSALTFTERQR